ncbi:MAG: hypothetical protein E7383_00070 [Ruminococcaceae bacterium]|nr:hypothetical protein [Oscillospiraceae bacterium]
MRILKKKVFILIFALSVSLLLSSCNYMMPNNKREEVMTEIAAVVNENYSSDEVETPYDISMTEIDELADKSSYLHKAIKKYDDVQHYHVYLVEDDMVLIVTDVIFQKVEGYVVSDEELEGTIIVHGLGYDNSQIRIIDRLGKSNVYSFSAGL